jgi:hypothetical protein
VDTRDGKPLDPRYGGKPAAMPGKQALDAVLKTVRAMHLGGGGWALEGGGMRTAPSRQPTPSQSPSPPRPCTQVGKNAVVAGGVGGDNVPQPTPRVWTDKTEL